MCGSQLSNRTGRALHGLLWWYGYNHGIALITVLMFIIVLILLGTVTATVTTLLSQSAGNYRASIQAFQAAEAGTEEARARLRANAANPIIDTAPTQAQWQAYIGSVTQAQVYGYDPYNALHVWTESLQTALPYTVRISHALDSTGHVLYWGDPTGQGNNTRNTTTGQNIYVVTSYGAAGGGHSIVQIQVVRVAPVPLRSAVYVDAPLTLQGSSTAILGDDHCGSTNLPGISTPLAEGTITENGHPTVEGSPPRLYNGSAVSLSALVNSYKGLADFTYTVNSATVTGMSWGTPTPGGGPQSASSCTESHIVYYNTAQTYVRLSGGVTGCGLLLVDGDLELSGGFSWYGVVIVTGSITFTGGAEKNISGSLMAGGGMIEVNVIGGNTTVVHCTGAIANAAQNRPLRVLNWGQL